MKWVEVSLITERVAAENAATLFDDYMGNGIIEEDVEDSSNLIKLTLYGEESISATKVLEDIKTIAQTSNFPLLDITTKVVDDETWYTSWQQYIEPVEILPNLIIKPSWQEYEKKGVEEIIEISSKLSFGTGAHETTRSCAQLLAKYITSNYAPITDNIEESKIDDLTCLDIGTGTGILLLVAAKLGLKKLVGIDIDKDAVEQAINNCHDNQVEAKIICGDLGKDFHGKANIILANLTVDPLKELLPIISTKLENNGILIISGIIDDRYDEIMPYITQNWCILEEVINNSWHTFALQAK